MIPLVLSSKIIEVKQIAGLYLIDNKWLWENIDKIEKDPIKGEYYLTDLIKIAADQNQKIEGVILDDHREALGVDTQVLLKEAEKINGDL